MENKNQSKDRKKKYNSKVTKEDISALGKKDMSMDSFDDRMLEDREEPVDFTGGDLDIPESPKRRRQETGKLDDEENAIYGQGGERKEHLEKRKDSKISRNIDPRRKADKSRE